MPATLPSGRQASALRKSMNWNLKVSLLDILGLEKPEDKEGWQECWEAMASALAERGVTREMASDALSYLVKYKGRSKVTTVEAKLGIKLGGGSSAKSSPKSAPKAATVVPVSAKAVAIVQERLALGQIGMEAYQLLMTALGASVPTAAPETAPEAEEEDGGEVIPFSPDAAELDGTDVPF